MNVTFKLVLCPQLCPQLVLFIGKTWQLGRSSRPAHDADGSEPLLTSSGVFYRPLRTSANQDEEGDEDGHDGNELRESGREDDLDLMYDPILNSSTASTTTPRPTGTSTMSWP